MPIISPGQVAIFYSLTTGALLGKLVLGPQDHTVYFGTPVGQGVLIQSTSQAYHDEACYALIAAHTSFAPNQNTDRCVVLDSTGTVIAVHKRDPAILPVRPGEAQLMLHPTADVGDALVSGTTFNRRCVHIKILPAQVPSMARNGSVLQVDTATVNPAGIVLPAAADKTQFVQISKTLNIGDTVDLTHVAPGLAAIIGASGV